MGSIGSHLVQVPKSKTSKFSMWKNSRFYSKDK
jgi:hypothetical protein